MKKPKIKLRDIDRDINLPLYWRFENQWDMDEWQGYHNELDGYASTEAFATVPVVFLAETSHLRVTLHGYITRECAVNDQLLTFTAGVSLDGVTPRYGVTEESLKTVGTTNTLYEGNVSICYVWKDLPAGEYELRAWGRESHYAAGVGYMEKWNMTADVCRA